MTQDMLATSATSSLWNRAMDRSPLLVIIGLVLLALLLLLFIYTYADYRKHRKPLVEADPSIGDRYTYQHHIKTVSVPLLKYRINISINRKPTGITKF